MTDLARLMEDIQPISISTKELMKTGAASIQEPNFRIYGNSVIRTADIGREEQEKILDVIAKDWPEEHSPWNCGYAGRCEEWVCDVYQAAGIPARGSCCAAAAREDFAAASNDIPVGAMVYSGSEYRSGLICSVCGRDSGHVAIYIGDGLIAGAQTEFIMDLDDFEAQFGYGGWSFAGNEYKGKKDR